MDDLIAFLRARLDEDEAVARAITASEWNEGCSWLADLRDPLPSQRRAYGLPKEWQLLSEADTKHIARWDPARVLAEVEAKRRILDEVVDQIDGMDDQINSEWGIGPIAPDKYASVPLLKLLALPHAEHLDYRPEWQV